MGVLGVGSCRPIEYRLARPRTRGPGYLGMQRVYEECSRCYHDMMGIEHVEDVPGCDEWEGNYLKPSKESQVLIVVWWVASITV